MKYLRGGSFSFYVEGSSEKTFWKGGQQNWKEACGLLQTGLNAHLPVIMLWYRTKWENDFQEKLQ